MFVYEIIYSDNICSFIEGPFDSVEDLMNHADTLFEDGATINIYELSLVDSVSKVLERKLSKK